MWNLKASCVFVGKPSMHANVTVLVKADSKAGAVMQAVSCLVPLFACALGWVWRCTFAAC